MVKKISIILLVILFAVFTFIVINNTLGIKPSYAAVPEWQKGMSILSKSSTDFSSDTFKQSLRNLRATGADYVSLVFNYYQSSLGSIDIHPGNDTPTDASIVDAIDYAHSLGMKVMLKPHLETDGTTWRALINPKDRDGWFTNYGAMLNHYADIAQVHNVEEICIGSELIDMTNPKINSTNTAHWINIINILRARYSGKLTYSSNWGWSLQDKYEEMDVIGFWSQLDYIGISAYFNIGNTTSNPTPAELQQSWDIWNKTMIAPLVNRYHKQVLFTEVGYRSLEGAHIHPWAYYNVPADQNEQAQDYNALFAYWNNYSYFAGIQMWNWDSNPNAGGEGDVEYTPQHKIAENILITWFGGSHVPSVDSSQATNPVFQVAATISANPSVHQATSIDVTFTNTANSLSNALADIEIYNANNVRVFQQSYPNQNFNLNKGNTYSFTWEPPTSGNYVIKTGVFSNDWQKTYNWSNSATPFTVLSGQNLHPLPVRGSNGNPVFTAYMDNAKVHAVLNQPMTFHFSVTNSNITTTNDNVQIQIWDKSGNFLYKNNIDNQDFAPYETHSYDIVWAPTFTGDYVIKFGVWNTNWTVTYLWVMNGGELHIDSQLITSRISPTQDMIEVWWPTNGNHISGLQPFEAVLTNVSLPQYTLYWQVERAALNIMHDSQWNAPHKEGLVDLSNWNWKGSGPYAVTFTAKDLHGIVIAHRTVNIYNQ